MPAGLGAPGAGGPAGTARPAGPAERRPGAPAAAAGPAGATGPAARRGQAGGTYGEVHGAHDGLVEALQALAGQPEVLEATDAVRQASTELRWHEALRRRWREARAEACVRDAVASASLEGAVVPSPLLREAVASGALAQTDGTDPALQAAAGVWRAGTRLADLLPDLRGQSRPAQPPAQALVAGLHRDAVGPLARAGMIRLEEVARPRGAMAPREGGPGAAPSGEELTERTSQLMELIDAPSLPALVRLALVHAEMACIRPFTAGNAAVGRLLVRYLAARDGLEPTAVSVPSRYPAQAPGAYAQALAGYASGTPQGVTGWVVWQAESLVYGVQEGQRLCRAIQAGQPD